MIAAGGQSRLVGNGSPESVTVPGEQETAGQIPEPGQRVLSGHTVTPGVQLVTSLAPPLHLLVVALQIGQGCVCAVSRLPLAFEESVLRTQTLSDGLGLTTGTGGP